MLVPVKGVKRYKSKGKWFAYHRGTGARIKAEYGSAAFVREVEREDLKAASKPAGTTVGSTIASYRDSSFFRDLALATRLSYERAFAEIEKGADLALASLTTGAIVSARDDVFAERGRWMANYYVTVFAVILDYARERGWVLVNPAKDIRRIAKERGRPRANRPWTPAECRAVLDAAPPYLAVPIGLAMLAGFRKADVLSIEWTAVAGGKITHRTAKRSVDVSFPVHPSLANILAAAPAHQRSTIAATSRGSSWTDSGFNSTFSKLIRRLEKAGAVAPGLTMHGLRHTVGTRLIEAGASIDTVRRLLGQRSTSMAQHYSETADVSTETTALVGKMKIVGERI